jgi:DNA mismatch repair protein MutS
MPAPQAQSTTRAAAAGRNSGQDQLVPSRRQYLELKAQHPGAILLYRLGDFYETFDDDALVVARDARIVLTSRSFGRSGRAPMAGIPHHALNHYLGKLLAAGHTIAIAEQLSPPGRGLVERGVTRVISPGTVADAALLPSGENRYLAAAHRLGDRWGLAWVDVSTGEFAVAELAGEDAATRLAEEIARLNPAELLLPDDAPEPPPGQRQPGHVTRLESWRWTPERARDLLCGQFQVRSLAAFGCAAMPAAVGAAGAALSYLERTNAALLPLLSGLRVEFPERWVGLDAATRRNLELTRSLGTGGTRGSLLGELDVTRTPMGARTLRRFVGQPLSDPREIARRQQVIGALVTAPADRASLGSLLAAVGDLERLLGRIAGGGATARDFVSLAAALRATARLTEMLPAIGGAASVVLDPCRDVVALLERAVEEVAGEAGIRPGFAPELDGAVDAVRGTRDWLAALEGRERARTGIRSLKVGYNKVFGYYIEVTRPNLGLVPADYARKQTVANGERFVTTPLKEAEARIMAADDAIGALEREALTRLSRQVTAAAPRLMATARALAELDALLALADVAARRGWSAPAIDESDILEITGGRHPVVEAHLAGESFIPNDCLLGGDGPRQVVVTGPNMGGKSTWLRQTALIVLLAQIGSWVPAAQARVGLVDRIFSRVGAHDDLARGQSTFMTEMVETAAILHQATSRSLVILDEVGRGTATADGLAIARAVLEDINRRVGARTLFATHYLELTAAAEELPGVANVHVGALEQAGRVIFLYAVRPGPADQSYGIQVARLAGLPPWVAERAERLLRETPRREPTSDQNEDAATLEAGGFAAEDRSDWRTGCSPPPTPADRLALALRQLDLDALTPREALTWLWLEQDRLSEEPAGS